jgi:hypothetical protein
MWFDSGKATITDTIEFNVVGRMVDRAITGFLLMR